MDRRRFLSSLLGGAIAAHELDIEKLLWVPGRKTMFIPPLDNSYIWLPVWDDAGVTIHRIYLRRDGTLLRLKPSFLPWGVTLNP